MPIWDRRVENDRLLLVEGLDEVNVFTELIGELLIQNVQVIDVGGKDQFRSRLEAIMADARARAQPISLRALGIVRDADESGGDAFKSVQGTLGYLNLPVPLRPRTATTATSTTPATAVLIVPNDVGPGDLETLCWEPVHGTQAARCVSDYVDCLKREHALESTSASKTLVHAYLASRSDPTSSAGLGAVKGYWQFDSPAFSIVREFIELIAAS